jgi:pimeloyl-ACP methyl ester carboxylesterase
LLGETPEDYDKHFILTADIDLSGHSFTTAVIAHGGAIFTGCFDGMYHTISNLNIDTIGINNEDLGLFGNSAGEIRNIRVENINLDGGDESYSLGGLVGQNSGTISNCCSTGIILGGAESEGMGGLVGEGEGHITKCYSACVVRVARNKKSYDLGGLVGYLYHGGSIIDCYAMGDVTGGVDSNDTAGLVGQNDGSIRNCYSTGDVTGAHTVGGARTVGGIVGSCEGGTVENCYFLAGSGPDNGFGIPLTDIQMKYRVSFPVWDFTSESEDGTESIWVICEGKSYPRLKWEIPVVLVPGWAHVQNIWDEFKRFLLRDNVTYADIELPQYSKPETNAQILDKQIETMREKLNWCGKIDIVTHSQGGLDARAYIHKLGDKAMEQVTSLTMIATPNHGTNGATLRDLWYRITLEPRKCTPWLTPGEVEKFNQKTPLVEGVKYYTVAGRLKYGLFSFKRDRIGSFMVSGEDDGVVPVESVLIKNPKVEHLGTFPYGHNELMKKEDVYGSVKSKIDPPYSEDPNSLAFITIEDGEVLTGQLVSRSVTVDDVNEVVFVLISAGPLDFALHSPSEEYITPQSFNANVFYDSGEWLDLLAQAYIVQEPVPGVWQAHVSANTEPNHFMLIVSAENTFVLNGSTDKYFNPLGEKVRLRATLGADATITDMRADIMYPNGLRETVILYDDGLHEDNSPNDGVYGDVFYPSLDGEYIIVFSTKGVTGGREFSRADPESIFVVTPTELGQ